MAQDTGGNNSAQTLVDIIRAYIIDNTIGTVNPAKLRTVLEAIANSVTASSGTAISATPPLNFDAFTNVFSLSVINDLITGGVNTPLSAEQGVELKKLIDSVTKQYIPLSGTETDNPINGTLEFKKTGELSNVVIWDDEGVWVIDLAGDDGNVNVSVNSSGNISLKNTLDGSSDVSSISPSNKLIYAQRVYCENPETLISALNNCDSTQLNTIKTILGI